MVLFIYFMYTKIIIEYIGYYLLIVSDTESKRNLPGLFIKCCRHRKNIGYIYGIFIYLCLHKKNIGIYQVYLLNVVDTE